MPALLTVILLVVAPVDQLYPELRVDVSVTLLPVQRVVDPDVVMVGVAGSGLTVTVVASEGWLRQPKLFVTWTV